MSRIRGRDTKPELLLRKALWREGFRYRIRSGLVGKPDLVFAGTKVVIFVDGCFWHGCPEHGAKPKTNKEFWQKKLARNRARDQEVDAALKAGGWNVVRIWEHQVKNDLEEVLSQVRLILRRNA